MKKGKLLNCCAPSPVGALIVVAGLSKRMEEFKPMLPLGDSTIIRTVITKLKAAGCDPIVLITGHRNEELAAHVGDLEVVCRFNPDYATSDMFRSVCIGLEYLRDKAERFFFLPGDVPLFKPETLDTLRREMDESGSPVIIPNHEGRKGHPLLMSQRVIPKIIGYKGKMGLRGALSTLGGGIRMVSVSDVGVTLDADHPEEYQTLLRLSRTP